ncbi:MAG: DHH family phosphoesterase [Candidatus Omnitrophica bacterium]|nr:DHH family phosphoesterase [Candidatus Omnitrophota bacterium]
MRNAKKAIKYIRAAKTVAISGHINPDGDSIGSMLALGLGLRRLGKKVFMLCQGEIPFNYRKLPGADTILTTTDAAVDLAIAVDCSARELLGRNADVFDRSEKVLVIDHHRYSKYSGDLGYIDMQAAAVGELIYMLLKNLNISITRGISENILTSIIVETNLFKVSNIRPVTFSICAEALKTGIDFSGLVNKVYGPKTKKSAALFSICLLRSRLLHNGKMIWSILRKKDLSDLGAKNYDADAIPSDMLALKGIKASVLFREGEKGLLRVSLRSSGGIDVGKIAQRYGGGGHFDISGCYIDNNPRSIKKILDSVSRSIP